MKSQGSLVPVGLIALALGMGAGCKKDEPPKPDPSVSPPSSAATQAQKPQHVNPRKEGAFGRGDPQAMKDYRLDVCYYGTLSIRQVRDSYLASLGKDEPGPRKLPSFGLPPAPAGAAGAASAKAPPPPPKPAASGAPGAPPAPDRRADFLRSMPHERNARACSAVIALKEPAMGDVDVQAAAYAPFAVELAKDLSTAQQYYQHEEYTKDAFAKGKELDKKLREGFAKFDDLSGKLGAALVGWRKEHPADTSKMDESEKLARASLDDARDVYMLVATKKADGEAWKTALDKLDKSVDAMKKAPEQPTSWAKIMAGPFDAFVKTAKESKVMPDKTFDPEGFFTLVTNFTGLIEARQRAVSRAGGPRPSMPMPAVPPPPATPPAP
jgi:Protein of unknown function (DUF3829)